VNRTYSLAEAAEQICGDEGPDPRDTPQDRVGTFRTTRRQALQLGVRIRAENGLVTHANRKL